ncbi:MAG: STAS domain-containing protein [Acidimicrobiia bacterium]
MSESQSSPTFAFSVERDGATGTVVARGEIDLASSPEFREAIHGLVDDGVRRLVIDLDAVSFIDSSGLGVLVGALKRVQEQGEDGGLVLRGLSGPALRVFEIAGLDQVFVLTS